MRLSKKNSKTDVLKRYEKVSKDRFNRDIAGTLYLSKHI